MWLRGWQIAILVIVVIVLIAFAVVPASLKISALPDPGPIETFVANHARDWLVRRAARRVAPPPFPATAANVAAGQTLFGMACAFCHGQEGRAVSPVGKAMYPRVVYLGSSEVQRQSDRELFWIIKHGIRLTGMPGFARIESDQQIWQLAYFVRSLKRPPAKH